MKIIFYICMYICLYVLFTAYTYYMYTYVFLMRRSLNEKNISEIFMGVSFC